MPFYPLVAFGVLHKLETTSSKKSYFASAAYIRSFPRHRLKDFGNGSMINAAYERRATLLLSPFGAAAFYGLCADPERYNANIRGAL